MVRRVVALRGIRPLSSPTLPPIKCPRSTPGLLRGALPRACLPPGVTHVPPAGSHVRGGGLAPTSDRGHSARLHHPCPLPPALPHALALLPLAVSPVRARGAGGERRRKGRWPPRSLPFSRPYHAHLVCYPPNPGLLALRSSLIVSPSLGPPLPHSRLVLPSAPPRPRRVRDGTTPLRGILPVQRLLGRGTGWSATAVLHPLHLLLLLPPPRRTLTSSSPFPGMIFPSPGSTRLGRIVGSWPGHPTSRSRVDGGGGMTCY